MSGLRAVIVGIEHFLKPEDAHVQCDVCGDQYQPTHGFGFYKWTDREKLNAHLVDAGWVVEGENRHICPNCQEKP